MTLEEQGQEAAPEAVETPQIDRHSPEQVEEAPKDAVTEEIEEEVEVDYKLKSEELEVKLEKEATGKQDKINKQRAALSQSNQKIRELQTQLNSLQVEQPSQEPSIDDFETHDDYVNALADFRADARFKESHAKLLHDQQEKLVQERNQKEEAEFAKQEHAYRVENPGYDAAKTELKQHLESFPVNGMVSDAVYEQASRDGGLTQVINYFGADGGANLPEFDRIMSLSPVEAAVEIYKLTQVLKSNSLKTKETKPSPKPVKVERGKSSSPKPMSKYSGKDVMDWVNQK